MRRKQLYGYFKRQTAIRINYVKAKIDNMLQIARVTHAGKESKLLITLLENTAN